MPKIKYDHIKFRPASLETIAMANKIIEEYQEQGFDLTLRQLYYQFVARGLIPNSQKEYKNLGSLVNDGRMAGLIDWNAIVDRTRNLRSLSHWDSPSSIVAACASQFRKDIWAAQPNYVEVWIEKDALVGVIEGVCTRNDVPYFSCRGYTSQSEMWSAARRIVNETGRKQEKGLIIHLGDHDPSGMDMSRDIQDRLRVFGARCRVHRIALNFDQVEQYRPPPNPAKTTDSRAEDYIANYGEESWELDALEPQVIDRLIQAEIDSVLDVEARDRVLKEQGRARAELRGVSRNWTEVVDYLAERRSGEDDGDDSEET